MKKIVLLFAVIGLIWVVWRFVFSPKPVEAPSKAIPTSAIIKKSPKVMKIVSSSFENGQAIPEKYSCDGESINPPLEFSEVPNSAKTLVLIVDDPDVPKNLKPDGVFDHWVVFNIPATTTSIKENSTPPGVQGLNSSSQNKYTGPCPPDKEHRYFFKLYALDTKLDFADDKIDKKSVEEKMKGHILDQAELVGVYNRSKN